MELFEHFNSTYFIVLNEIDNKFEVNKFDESLHEVFVAEHFSGLIVHRLRNVKLHIS